MGAISSTRPPSYSAKHSRTRLDRILENRTDLCPECIPEYGNCRLQLGDGKKPAWFRRRGTPMRINHSVRTGSELPPDQFRTAVAHVGWRRATDQASYDRGHGAGFGDKVGVPEPTRSRTSQRPKAQPADPKLRAATGPMK